MVLYTLTHSAQDVTAIEAELKEEVQLRTVVSTQIEQQKANKAPKTGNYRE